jgi:hypothetical protein
MGKSTISMAIFNSFLYVYQRVIQDLPFVLPRFFWCPARWFSIIAAEARCKTGSPKMNNFGPKGSGKFT